MANIAFSTVVSNARGKCGQSVFIGARSGATLRVRVIPANPQSASQEAARARMSEAATAFRNLSATNLARWQAYALTLFQVNPVSGTVYHPTAVSVFVQLTTKYRQLHPVGSLPTTPPTAPYAGDTATITVSSVEPDLISASATAANNAVTTTEFLYQYLRHANSKPVDQFYRHLSFFDFSTGAAVEDIASEVTLDTGKYVSIAVRYIHTTSGMMTRLQNRQTLLVG